MRQDRIFLPIIALITTVVTACTAVTPFAPSNIPATQVETSAAYPTVISNPAPTQSLSSEQYGTVKYSLEAIRNGKTYELLLAYQIRHQGSQTYYFPETNPEINVTDANMQWVGDIDADGELEYIIELVFCGVYCSNEVQVFHYDATMDNYQVLDTLSGYGAEKYIDINTDGNPEIISQDYDYQFKVGGAGATRWLSPIKIYRYEIAKQKFAVVTNEYPDWVTNDANSFLKEIKSDKSSIANFLKLAAYLYDMDVLGRQEEGIKIFSEVCPQYVKPTIENPDWTCEGYLSDIQKILSETKFGSK